jgi:hypothetical protein
VGYTPPMENGSMVRILALLIAGAAVVLAAGCGDDDEDAAGTTAGTAAGTSAGTSSGTTGASSSTTGASSGTTVPRPGGTARGADAQAYVDAMIQSFDNSDPDELQINREQAQCLAPLWVEAIGADRLAAAGIEPQDFAEEGDVDLTTVGLTEDNGNAMYDAFGECDIDVKTLFVDSFSADRDVSEEDQVCLADAMSDDLLRRIMVTTFVEGEEALNQDEELSGELFGVFAECPGLVATTTTGGG